MAVCLTQLRITCLDGSNSHAGLAIERPERCSSTILRRNSSGCGGRLFGIGTDSSPSSGDVSTRPGPPQYATSGYRVRKMSATATTLEPVIDTQPTARAYLAHLHALFSWLGADSGLLAAPRFCEIADWARALLADEARLRALHEWQARGLDVPRMLHVAVRFFLAPGEFSQALLGVAPAARAAGRQRARFQDIDQHVDTLARHEARFGAVPGLDEMRLVRTWAHEAERWAAMVPEWTEESVDAEGRRRTRGRRLRGCVIEIPCVVAEPAVVAAPGRGRPPEVELNVLLLIFAGHFAALSGAFDAAELARLLTDILDWELPHVADSRRALRQAAGRAWASATLYGRRARLLAGEIGLAIRLPDGA